MKRSVGIPWTEAQPAFLDVEIEFDVSMRTRDNVGLRCDIYRPKGAQENLPVLLMRHPYDKTVAMQYGYALPHWYARQGYIVVVQDCRGRWSSGGDWTPFQDEPNDGYDTVKWAAQLPGSTGKVGMYGFSYGGATQLAAAGAGAPGLAAIAPAFTNSDYYDGWTYRGGALHHAFTQSWATFLGMDTARRRGNYELEQRLLQATMSCASGFWRDPSEYAGDLLDDVSPYYYEWLQHSTYDDYWKRLSFRSIHESIWVPALHIGGWYDIFIDGTIENYLSIKEKSGTEQTRLEQRLVIGPWYHSPWTSVFGEMDFGADALSPIEALQIQFFDAKLKGKTNELSEQPPVALFVMGLNRWRFEDKWPLARAENQRFYLRSAGRANSTSGNGKLSRQVPVQESPDNYAYDPRDPVIAIGGHSCCSEALAPMGPRDQRCQENRNDVLVYTSDVLDAPLEVTGLVEAVVYAASTVCDTDFVVKLVDVYPDGRAINILEGIVRASARESLAEHDPIEANRVYKYNIKLGNTSIVFLEGHRLRIDITSSCFPTFDRNSNSGKRLLETTCADYKVALQTVFHDHRYPSHVILPVVN